MKASTLGVILVAVLSLPLMTACSTVGPKLILNSHIDYNKAVKQVVSEELLLNVVRRRYAESPQFVQVSSISTSLGLSADASADAGWNRSGLGRGSWNVGADNGTISGGRSGNSVDNVLQLGNISGGGGVGFSDTPTVTITPLSGESITSQLTKRMSCETIGKLTDSGYRADIVLPLMVEAFTNIRGPYVGTGNSFRPGVPEYVELINRLGALFERDQLMIGTWLWEDPWGDITYTPEQITPENQIAVIALGEGLGRWRSLDGGKTYFFTDHNFYAAMYIPEDARKGGDGKRVIELLNLQPEPLKKIWYFQPAKVLHGPDLTIQEDEPRMDVKMLVRSFYSVMTLLAFGVEVPPEDEANGRAISTGSYRKAVQEGCAFDTANRFVVHWSKKRPDNASVSVKYRGKWFYIDDGDYESKVIFAGLYDLFNLEALPPSDGQSPILTLPVN